LTEHYCWVLGRGWAGYLAAAYEIVEQRSWVQIPPGPFLSALETTVLFWAHFD